MSEIPEEVLRAKKAQEKAITDLLYQFAQKISELKQPVKQSDLYALAAKEMLVVCRLMNGQTLMALLSQQKTLKDIMTSAGKEAIDMLRRVYEMEDE